MSAYAEISTEGFLDAAKALDRTNQNIDKAAALGVNRAARDGRTLASRQIRDEINYPRSYLGGEQGRLMIAQRATQANPEAIIRGRDRPTSLARFAASPIRFGRQNGVRVRVSALGAGQTLRAGFYIRLKNNNVGLAIRLKKGESLHGSTAAKKLADGLWLLYGPSVDQAFHLVARDIVGEVGDIARDEFFRQLDRLENANG